MSRARRSWPAELQHYLEQDRCKLADAHLYVLGHRLQRQRSSGIERFARIDGAVGLGRLSTVSQGVGAIASVGAQVAVGGTKDPTPAGVSTSKTIQFDGNAGVGQW